MATASNTVMDASALAALRTLLEEERREAHVGIAGRVALRLLTSVTYALPIVVGLVLLGERLADLRELPATALWALEQASGRLESFVIPLVVALVVLAVVDLPVIYKSYRQWRLSRRVVALRLLEDAAAGRPPLLRWWGPKPLLLVAPISLLSLFLANLPNWLAPPAPGLTRPALWQAVGVLSVMVFLPATLLLGNLALRQARARVDYLREVVSLVAAVGEGGAPGAFADETLARLADIERLHILRASAAALQRSDSTVESGFALRKSERARAVLRSADPAVRLEIEEALERLLNDLRSPERQRLEVLGGVVEMVFAGAVWRIEYELDEVRGIVEVIAVTDLGEAGF